MKYTTVTVNTDHASSELVSYAMFDAGAEGTSIIDKQDFLDLVKSDVIWDYVDESVLSEGDLVKVGTVVPYGDKEFVRALTEKLEELKTYGGVRYGEIVVGEVDAKDWENEWKKYYKPIVTREITVVPTWINYPHPDSERIMRLDPGMAFGTGEHATTRMCLELMDVTGKSVIDVGCGSGILGIAAKLCGATSVYMCDIDPQAVEFARRNAELNSVDAVIEEADLIAGTRTADFIFANITADILMRLASSLYKHLNDGGTVVLSGIIDSRLEEVTECYEKAGYKVTKEMRLDDWRALKLVR